MRPEPVLRAYDARLADQSVAIVAAKCDQSANGQTPLAQAGAPNTSIKRRHWHHALNDYKKETSDKWNESKLIIYSMTEDFQDCDAQA